jgi:electron transfer flavoprotein beta subunit
MPNIVVLIKQVPDTWSERKLTDSDYTLDRGAADAVLDEINERSVEEALQIKERDGGEVVVLTVGPERAGEAVRKALSMGADRAVHVQDDAIRGSDAIQTSWVIAKALGTIEGVSLVIAGNESTDGRVGAVPAIVAEYLGLPQLTSVREITLEGESITAVRETDEAVYTLKASLPAIVSVTEKINEPRFPSFKGIMAAKKKPVEVLSLADLGVEADEVGFANAGSKVQSVAAKPPKSAGEKVVDEGDGDGGPKIAQYLISHKII